MSLAFAPELARTALLALSAGVAMLACQVSLDLAQRLRVVKAAVGLRWLLAAALAFGTGIWSVHVLALAAAPPLPYALGHHPGATLAVWLLAAAVGLCGLGALSMRVLRWSRLLPVSAALGVGLAGAQAAALVALGVLPGIDWSPWPLAGAVAVAASGSMLAFAFALRVRGRRRPVPQRPAIAAAILGLTMVLSEHLVLHAAGLAAQTHALFQDRVAPGVLTALASIGAIALLLALSLLSALEARLRASLRRAEGELQRQSFRDPLTRLPNRLMFESALAGAVQGAGQEEGRFAVLFVDLDGFKPINESFGHHGGDRLLRIVAGRLRAHARPHDLVAHLGGDEFLMLVRGNPGAEELALLSGRLLAAINLPCRIGACDAVVSGSIGIALCPDPNGSASPIARAEAAMLAAKGSGGAMSCFFEPRMLNGAREQVELLQDLRAALPRGQLELYYQPKIHAPSGEITGAEALLRWHHPERGLVSPSVFIPIAERFGLIGAMGNWVIDEACRQARAWRDQGLMMRVAINLSVHQLRNPELLEHVGAALRRHEVNPRLLTFEVTESVAMEDADGAIAMFEKLANAGVHLSIDDFGTGYSSLACLRKLRAAELKIDRSFVLDLESSDDARAVVDAVVKLAQALGIKVVAEGVETEQQHTILRSLGCDELQGFLFARPMPAKALALWAIDDVGPRALDFRDSLYQTTSPGALH
jgi:diguanylate cyclase (GGDEF)-like protein